MRALIISDVHSNLEALQKVLEDAEQRGGFDAVWCLGDVVGYGPDPGPCIETLAEQELLCVVGNHDYAALGRMGVETFNSYAAQAALWTRTQLEADHVAFLEGLPKVASWGEFSLAHGSLRDPLWEYLVSAPSALENFRRMTTPFCLVGHSHLPFVCFEVEGMPRFNVLRDGQQTALDSGRIIANPGSVGQPRDGDPRASYLLYDDEERCLAHHRVAYDVSVTQERMRRAGLHPYLIERLSYGR